MPARSMPDLETPSNCTYTCFHPKLNYYFWQILPYNYESNRLQLPQGIIIKKKIRMASKIKRNVIHNECKCFALIISSSSATARLSSSSLSWCCLISAVAMQTAVVSAAGRFMCLQRIWRHHKQAESSRVGRSCRGTRLPIFKKKTRHKDNNLLT